MDADFLEQAITRPLLNREKGIGCALNDDKVVNIFLSSAETSGLGSVLQNLVGKVFISWQGQG